MQVFVQVIDFFHLTTPPAVLVHLVDEQMPPAHLHKVVCHIHQGMSGEVVGISRTIQHMAVISLEVLLDILQHHR